MIEKKLEIPLLDLKRQFCRIAEEIESEVKGVFESQRFILGEKVKALEDAIAGYCNVRYGIGVASGSDAILLSLMAIGIGRDDLVITTPYTFFSTAGSIARLGAKPVFVDIEPETFNIDPNRLEDCLKKLKVQSSKLKAIIPVHLFGQCADMDRILELASMYGLKVIEDAAQAIGATYRGRMAGGMGDAGCLSFFPTKNLGGFGDGGMVLTNDDRLADTIKLLRVHGSSDRYHHIMIGLNSRLDEIQAAVLLVKFRYLREWTEKRRANAERYKRLFEDAGLGKTVKYPVEIDGCLHVYNQFVIRVTSRDRLKRFLLERGVSTEIYYPVPLHLQRCFEYLGYRKGDFPQAEKAAEETLALPVYPELDILEQESIVESIREFYGTKG